MAREIERAEPSMDIGYEIRAMNLENDDPTGIGRDAIKQLLDELMDELGMNKQRMKRILRECGISKNGYVDLAQLAAIARFRDMAADNSSIEKIIISELPVYYRWTGDSRRPESAYLELLTFETPTEVETLKIFRYKIEDTFRPINLTRDQPDFAGRDAVRLIIGYIGHRYNSKSLYQ